MTTTIKQGPYGGTYRETRYGEFETFFLYNMDSPTHSFSNGDVWDMKCYKTQKMAISKINKYIQSQVA